MLNRANIIYSLVIFLLTTHYAIAYKTVSERGFLSNSGVSVIKISEEHFEITEGNSEIYKYPPYFDHEGNIQWLNSVPLLKEFTVCSEGLAEVARVTLILNPRVDLVHCKKDKNSKTSKSYLAGINEIGKLIWQRSLGYISGVFTIYERVIGATSEAIVLSDLAVIEPRTGNIIFQVPTHSIGQERRSVPDHDLTGSAVYLAERHGFLWFFADVTLVERNGGIYFIDAETGRKELFSPVSTSLLGGYWRVEEMERVHDSRYVLLAQQFAIRGPGAVSLAILDLEQHKIVYEDRFGKNCSNPQVVSGSDGNFGFSYIDHAEGKRVLVHYRIKPKKS